MSGETLLTIIILTVMTGLIIGLTIFGYLSILKIAKKSTATGVLDDEFIKEAEHDKKKRYKVLHVVGQVTSAAVALCLVALATVSAIYKIKGEQFVFNDHVSFVIASNSMDGYSSKEYSAKLVESYTSEYNVDEESAQKELGKYQFKVGDLASFKLVNDNEELKAYEVYGYKNADGVIITHRYLGENADGTLIFRGDNAHGNDTKVNRSQVLYRYEGNRTRYIGSVVLFFGSGFGIYSIIAITAMYLISDVVIYKWEKMKKARLHLIEEESSAASRQSKRRSRKQKSEI